MESCMKKLICIMLLIFSVQTAFSQGAPDSFFYSQRHHELYGTITNTSLFDNGLNNTQFSIRHSVMPVFTKWFYGEIGINSTNSQNFNLGLMMNLGVNLNITDQLVFRPLFGTETQLFNWSNNYNIGGNLDYFIKSDNDLFGSYILGLNFRYPFHQTFSKDINKGIYQNNLPVIELKFGIGF